MQRYGGWSRRTSILEQIRRTKWRSQTQLYFETSAPSAMTSYNNVKLCASAEIAKRKYRSTNGQTMSTSALQSGTKGHTIRKGPHFTQLHRWWPASKLRSGCMPALGLWKKQTRASNPLAMSHRRRAKITTKMTTSRSRQVVYPLLWRSYLAFGNCWVDLDQHLHPALQRKSGRTTFTVVRPTVSYMTGLLSGHIRRPSTVPRCSPAATGPS